MPFLRLKNLLPRPLTVNDPTGSTSWTAVVPALGDYSDTIPTDSFNALAPQLKRLAMVGQLIWDVQYYGADVLTAGTGGGAAAITDASQVPYTPVAPVQWSPVPTNVAIALDELAQRNVLTPPLYNAQLVARGGAMKWQQVEEVTATFTGASAQVNVLWNDFSTRPFRIYVAEPDTNDVNAIEIQVIQSSVTSTGCTLQANIPFSGTVAVTIKEIV